MLTSNSMASCDHGQLSMRMQLRLALLSLRAKRDAYPHVDVTLIIKRNNLLSFSRKKCTTTGPKARIRRRFLS